MERKRIYLCLAHMSDKGLEQKYINNLISDWNDKVEDVEE